MRLLALALALIACQNDHPPPPRPAVAVPGMTEEAPWTLTASDGSGLVMTRVDAKAVVEGPLAFTELHLYFHNPEARIREGTFAITLPPGAAVSRFAMEADGRWQEAEVVEKMFARRVYDDFLHRRQDPALLEKTAGNQFTARVFPIAGQADKHLVIAFSQALAGTSYTLPLRGLPTTERVDVHLAVTQPDGSRRDQALAKRYWRPDRDFVAAAPVGEVAVGSGELVVASVALAAGGAASDAPKQLTVLVDTSASRGLGFASYIARVHQLIGALRERYGAIALSVIAFDQDSQRIFDGSVADYGATQDRALIVRGAAGASDLGQALAAVTGHGRLVVVTDGVVTAGAETAELVAAARKLPIDRLDVVLAGGIRDEHLAAALARAGLPHAGDVYDLDRGIAEVASGLGEAVTADVAIEVTGATWVYPKRVPALRSGGAVTVYARMAAPVGQVAVAIGGERHTLAVGKGTPAFVERALAGAEIDELEIGLAANDEPELRDQIAKLSVTARVISSQTSMLVLESAADYARYHIDQHSLTDILVVGDHGIEQSHRTLVARAGSHELDPTIVDRSRRRGPIDDRGTPVDDAPTIEPQLARSMAIEEARTAGQLGSTSTGEGSFASLTGAGEVASGFDESNLYGGLVAEHAQAPSGGGGTGSPIGVGRYATIGQGAGHGAGYGVGGGRGGMRGRRVSVPSVTIGQPVATGDLDKSIIRRYIKRSTERITYCYERVLLAKPALRGTVTVQFFVGQDGRVATANASGLDEEVATCVADTIKDIEFPAPRGGGGVQVNYPFTFIPAGSAVRASDAGFTPSDPPAPAQEVVARLPARAFLDGPPPLTGKLADVMAALGKGRVDQALAIAGPWHDQAPGDVLALVAYGEALEAGKQLAHAARIYGSIIDLYPSRADLRRFAGERLERVGSARKLAIDTYRRAVADRPDHLSGHRLLAYALLRDGDHAGAFTAILAGIDQPYPANRFPGGDRVLAEDAGMIAAAYLAHGGDRADVTNRLERHGAQLAAQPSTRFILYWETDANDVDFHIVDREGGHAWYREHHLPSGGELYADITTGYGPECFAIQGTPKAGPYHLSINYYSQGPMGYGMGLLQIQKFDGKDLVFEDRPYMIMTAQAFVDLGTSP